MKGFPLTISNMPEKLMGHSQPKYPNSSYGNKEEHDSLFEIYFLGMAIHQSNTKIHYPNTL